MRNLFKNYLKTGLSEYNLKYLPTYQYIMLLFKDNNITAYFANVDYSYFIEYSESDKEYNSPIEVLKSEISLTASQAGVIYENINGQFKTIAFIDLNEEN